MLSIVFCNVLTGLRVYELLLKMGPKAFKKGIVSGNITFSLALKEGTSAFESSCPSGFHFYLACLGGDSVSGFFSDVFACLECSWEPGGI